MRLAKLIIKNKLAVCIIFAIVTIACIVAVFFVDVNYDMTSYMPEGSELSEGLSVMYDEFDNRGVAQIMAKNMDFDSAIKFKNEINDIDGVSEVIWLDTMMSSVVDKVKPHITNVSELTLVKYLLMAAEVFPAPTQGDSDFVEYYRVLIKVASVSGEIGLDMSMLGSMKDTLSDYFRSGSVMFQVFFDSTDYDQKTFDAIEQIKALDTETHLLGNSAMVYNSRKTLETQTLIALVVAGVIVIIILFIMSSSYLEPILFLFTIGIAVVLNMGTNIIMPNISYMTQSISSVLQLALTMDYSIFLLHKFKQERENGGTAEEAMGLALKHSFSPISASSLTTIVSFVAIMFMSYTIGFDLGFVLAKGVVFSILSVFLLLPALVLFSNKILEKSAHKTFKLNFKKHCTFLIKTRKILPIIILCLVIPCVFLQGMNTFTYGNGATFGGENSTIYDDREAIEEVFGVQNQIAVLLPGKYADKELELTLKLLDVKGVKAAQSLALIQQSGMAGMMPDNLLAQFTSQSGNYSRLVVFLNVPEESGETTETVLALKSAIESVVDEYYLLGESPSVLEIKEVVEVDYNLITILSIVLVALIIAITFKSLVLPIILVFAIQGAIWMSMMIPYFIGTPIVFLGYLIVSAILLGTTIDYAILYTNNYIKARGTKNKSEALREAMGSSSKTIVTSASIFTLIGFAILIVTTMPAIRVFGLLIGLGGLMAMLMVLILLPQLLLIFDKVIQKTTHKIVPFYNAIEPPPFVDDEFLAANINIAEIHIENVNNVAESAADKRNVKKSKKRLQSKRKSK